MNTDVFEYATRNKIRFQSSRGDLAVEHLWDVPLRSRDDFNLNAIAKAANKAWKDATEESFVEATKTAAHVRLETALEVVKHVIDAKLAEETSAKKRADNKVEKEKLLAILAEKQAGKLSEMIDVEELTIKQVRELTGLLAGGSKEAAVPLPFRVGDAILIRTVTMIQLGRVQAIGADFIVLEDGGWVADTGRFSTMLETGSMSEFERAKTSWFLVGRGAIVDVFPWAHEIPKATK